MTLLIQKLQDRADNKLVAPVGWLMIEELETTEKEKQLANLNEFELSVSQYLPLAAKKAQKLIQSLNDNLNIKVNISYLTINDSTTFHVTMLVNMTDYLSPGMQAARIIAAKNKSDNEGFDMQYTFAAGIERIVTNSVANNNYKFKKITSC